MRKPAAIALFACVTACASGGLLELRGQVTGAGSAGHLRVQLFGVETPYTGSAEIDKTGAFRFRDLEPGNYTVAVVRQGLGEVRRTVVVTPGLADARGVVRAEIPYSASEAAHMKTDAVSRAALSVGREAREKYEQAQVRRARRDLVGAVALFQEAATLAPQFADAWNALGVLAFQSGDIAAAERYYRRGVDADAQAFEPLVNLGALLLRAGRAGEALAFNERAAHQRPHDPLALVQLGMNLFQVQRYSEAEAPLLLAKQIDPAHHMQPQLFLAEIHHRRGEWEKAIAEIEELLLLRPDSAMRDQLVQTIATLHHRD